MTVHNAKGLEFEVVAVPDLARGLLSGGRRPVLALGREQPPRVGLQWRRLGRAAVNLYDYGELIEAGEARDSEEGLRLFHVAATRARERLILSGVVKPEPAKEMKPGTAVIERLVEALGVARPAARTTSRGPRRDGGRRATSRPTAPGAGRRPAAPGRRTRSSTASRCRPPSRARASTRPSPPRRSRSTSTCPRRSGPPNCATCISTPRPTGRSAPGTPPLVERKPPIVPSRPLSYTAISAFEECGYRFYMERVLGLPAAAQSPTRNTPSHMQLGGGITGGLAGAGDEGPRRGRNGARGAPRCTRCWSGARRTGGASRARSWRGATRSPPGLIWTEVDRRRRRSGGRLRRRKSCSGRCATGSARRCARRSRRRRGSGPRCRSCCAPKGTVLRGSIDLLVEREGAPPLVVDYKTDRLRGEDPAERAAHYEIQRSIYALAAAESLGADEVEVAYVFLERADAPARTILTARRHGRRPGPHRRRGRRDQRRRVRPRPRTRAHLGPLPRLPRPRPLVLRPP